MTKTWKIAEAKARFSELVQSATSEPQTVLKRDEPIAVVMSIDRYNQLAQQVDQPVHRPLREILKDMRKAVEEEGEIEIPPRTDRPLPDFD